MNILVFGGEHPFLFMNKEIKNRPRENGSVSLLLAGDYTTKSGCATRFRRRVDASQNIGLQY